MSQSLDAVFRPHRGRIIPLVVAGVLFAMFAAVCASMVGLGAWSVGDALTLMGLAALICAFLARYAAIRAVARPEGLRIRNLMLSRTVPWHDIAEVRFPEGDPWPHLELMDTDVIAVMAIQRVDGPRSRTEAQRLADLVDARQRA